MTFEHVALLCIFGAIVLMVTMRFIGPVIARWWGGSPRW